MNKLRGLQEFQEPQTICRLQSIQTQCFDIIQIICHYGSFQQIQKAKQLVNINLPHIPLLESRHGIVGTFCASDRDGWFYISAGDMDVLRAYDRNGSLVWSLDNVVHDPAQIVARGDELFVLAWDSAVSDTPWKQTRLLYVFGCKTGILKRQQNLHTHKDCFQGHPKTMGILSTGEFVLTDWADYVVIFDKNGVFKSKFKISDYSIIESIYVHIDDTIWLSGGFCDHDIAIYNREGNLLSTINLGSDCHQVTGTPLGEVFAATNKGIFVLNADRSLSRVITNANKYCGVAVSVHGRMIAGGLSHAAIFE